MRKYSIRLQFLCFILAFSLIPSMIAAWGVNYYCEEMVKRNSEEFLNACAIKMDNNISELALYLKSISTQFTTFNPLYKLLLDDTLSNQEKNEEFSEMILQIMPENNGICAVSAVLDDGGIYTALIDDNMPDLPSPQQEFLRKCTRTDLCIDENVVKGNKKNYIIMGQRFFNFYSGVDIGNLIFYIDECELWKSYKDFILEDSEVFITINDVVISHKDKSLIGYKMAYSNLMAANEVTRKQPYEMIMVESSITTNLLQPGPKVIQIVSRNRIFEATIKIKRTIGWLCLGAFLIALCLAIFIPYRLLEDLVLLKKNIGIYMRGRIPELPEGAKSEVYELEFSFHKMIEQIETLNKKSILEREQKKNAEMKALSSQINPHFIYNALDTAVWVLKLGNPEKSEKILRALGTYYRIGLHKGSVFIKVREEIEHVKMYVEIESIRHLKNKFSVEYDIAPEILDYYTLKIILQPLVENCIKHGFRKIDYEGKILITGREDTNGDVVFRIEDNGVGCTEQDIINDIKNDDISGYGLKNINERLVLEYGEEYRLKFTKSKLGGLCVTLRIGRRNID